MTTPKGYKETLFQKFIQILNALWRERYHHSLTDMGSNYGGDSCTGIHFQLECHISKNLNQAINKSMIIDDQQEANFYMEFYIMDVLCGGKHFPYMN
jgi:hypothetical protein